VKVAVPHCRQEEIRRIREEQIRQRQEEAAKSVERERQQWSVAQEAWRNDVAVEETCAERKEQVRVWTSRE
jgi:hypothetical protein